jgi:hypothetical protein
MESEPPPGKLAETDETDWLVRATASTSERPPEMPVVADATTENGWALVPPVGT